MSRDSEVAVFNAVKWVLVAEIQIADKDMVKTNLCNRCDKRQFQSTCKIVLFQVSNLPCECKILYSSD